MYKVVFEKRAKKEFLKLDRTVQEIVAKGLIDLERGNFQGDKVLKGKYGGKFCKRVGNYRIIYYKEDDIVLITIVRIAHRKEAY